MFDKLINALFGTYIARKQAQAVRGFVQTVGLAIETNPAEIGKKLSTFAAAEAKLAKDANGDIEKLMKQVEEAQLKLQQHTELAEQAAKALDLIS